MNWSKGFFRVWVVFSVLWICGFAIDAYQSKPYFQDAYVYEHPVGTIKKVSTYGAEADALNELKERGILTKFIIKEFPELTVFDAQKLMTTDKQKNESIGDLLALIKKGRDAEISAYRSKSFWYFIQFGLGTPLILLMLGGAVAWALKGFKRTGKNT
jgi:hypothetical protein